MFQKIFIVFAFLLVKSIFAKSQVENDSFIFENKVINIDSQYYLIPRLIIIPKFKTIIISKKRLYVNEIDQYNADGVLTFQRLIGKMYVNLYVDMFNHRLYDKNWDKEEIFGPNSTLNDTLNISKFIPLEPGEYRVKLEFRYWEKGKSKSIISKWQEFQVYYRPKGSIFFDD